MVHGRLHVIGEKNNLSFFDRIAFFDDNVFFLIHIFAKNFVKNGKIQKPKKKKNICNRQMPRVLLHFHDTRCFDISENSMMICEECGRFFGIIVF